MARDKNFNIMSALSYALMGVFLAANQSLVLNIAKAFSVGEQMMGAMIGAIYGGTVAAVLFLGPLAQRVGKRKAAIASALATCAGALMIGFTGSAAFAVVGFFIYGAGIGGFETYLMALVADNNGDASNRFMNFLQALFSIGAVLAPLIVTALFAADEFRPFYIIITACYAAAICYLVLRKNIDDYASPEKKTEGLAILKLARHPFMLVYILSMTVYIGSETAFTYWIATYLEGEGMGQVAALALSSYWFSSIFGRLLATRFSEPSRLMAPCFLAGAAGCIMLIAVPFAWLKVAAVVLVGLVFSPLYAGLSLLAGTLFPEESASAFSLIIFAMGLGGIGFQPFISLLLASGGAVRVYVILAVLCALFALPLYLVSRKREKLF